ncbi:hypothetical protein [Halpernia sp.]|uniref:hypothetical protein n=1 Tax=Halpernia sp. TaxID=2782209 RepID=UPI003A94A148
MKNNLIFIIFLFGFSVFSAQKHPSTLEDLYFFIGKSSSNFEKMMKSYGYPLHDKRDDTVNANFTVQFYEGEEYEELKVYRDGNKITAIGFEYFTDIEASRILDFVQTKNFTKICGDKPIDSKNGLGNGAWKRIDGKYKVYINAYDLYGGGARKLNVIVADNSANWTCEKTYKPEETKLLSTEQIKNIEAKINNTYKAVRDDGKPRATKQEIVEYLNAVASNTNNKKIYKSSKSYIQDSWFSVKGNDVTYYIKETILSDNEVQTLRYEFSLNDISTLELNWDDNLLLNKFTFYFYKKPAKKYYVRPTSFQGMSISDENKIKFYMDSKYADKKVVHHAFMLLFPMK